MRAFSQHITNTQSIDPTSEIATFLEHCSSLSVQKFNAKDLLDRLNGLSSASKSTNVQIFKWFTDGNTITAPGKQTLRLEKIRELFSEHDSSNIMMFEPQEWALELRSFLCSVRVSHYLHPIDRVSQMLRPKPAINPLGLATALMNDFRKEGEILKKEEVDHVGFFKVLTKFFERVVEECRKLIPLQSELQGAGYVGNQVEIINWYGVHIWNEVCSLLQVAGACDNPSGYIFASTDEYNESEHRALQGLRNFVKRRHGTLYLLFNFPLAEDWWFARTTSPRRLLVLSDCTRRAIVHVCQCISNLKVPVVLPVCWFPTTSTHCQSSSSS